MITAQDLLARVMNAPLACYSKQELWHRYLADIGPGDECLEFGVASGRSITCMAEMRPRTDFWGFDSFEGLPEAWGRCEKGRFRVDVKRLKFPPNVRLQIGLFANTLPGFISSQPLNRLRGVHIDCDLGSSTRTIFDALGEHIMAKKPLMLFDEFYNYRGYEDHEFGAFLEWVNKTETSFEVIGRDVLHKQVLIAIQ